MRGKVKHLDKLRFQAKVDTGPEFVMDASRPKAERQGPTPMETIMLSAACCSATDVVDLLRKMRRPPEEFEISVEGSRAEEDPRVFVSMDLLYRLKGEALDPASVERAIALSVGKYCSAIIMLARAGVKITTKYEIAP